MSEDERQWIRCIPHGVLANLCNQICQGETVDRARASDVSPRQIETIAKDRLGLRVVSDYFSKMIQQERCAPERLGGIRHSGGLCVGQIAGQQRRLTEIWREPHKVVLLVRFVEPLLVAPFEDETPFVLST